MLNVFNMTINPKSILLVEDDPDDIELFRIALTETNPDYQLTIVKNGNSLVNILNEIKIPDIIVLDVNLPQISCEKCLKEIRLQEKLHKVPVVILTGYSKADYIKECLSNGASRYYIKPTTFDDIKHVVAEICALTG